MSAGVTVRELMNREYVGVSESDDLVETVELLLREDAETAVVQRGPECVGILTERDILATLVEGPDPETATVGDTMTESVPTVDPGESLDGALAEMATQSLGGLVVVNGSEPIGLVTKTDLLNSRAVGATQTESGRARAAATAETPQDAPGSAPADPEVNTMEAGSTARATTRGSDQGFEDQSICEGCGSLASDLSAFNGQLLCPDCRDI